MIRKMAANVALLMIASLFVAGCISPTSNSSPMPTQTPTSGGHNAVLEKFVAMTREGSAENSGEEILTWNETWLSDTRVTVLTNTSLKNNIQTLNLTLLAFPTARDATNYLRGVDKENYSLISTDYKTGAVDVTYTTITGHDPQTFQYWAYVEAVDTSYETIHEIYQYDNVLQFNMAVIF